MSKKIDGEFSIEGLVRGYDNRDEPLTTEQEFFSRQIDVVFEGAKELLLSKNRKYGNSALSPKRIFSKADAIEQLKVRIDDKLSRLANQQSDEDEDAELDLLGYLILLRIARLDF